MFEKVLINREYVTLGQFLKLADVIQSGGQAKWYLSEFDVIINGEQDQRRGRKLYPGDQIELEDQYKFVIEAEEALRDDV